MAYQSYLGWRVVRHPAKQNLFFFFFFCYHHSEFLLHHSEFYFFFCYIILNFLFSSVTLWIFFFFFFFFFFFLLHHSEFFFLLLHYSEFGGAGSVTVIIRGNEHGYPSSNPGWGWLLILLGKVWIQLFYCQLWVNSWVDLAL